MPFAHQKIVQLKRLTFFFISSCLLVFLFYIAIRYYHIHYHATCWLNSCASPSNLITSTAQKNQDSFPLHNLEFDIHHKVVPGVKSNLSGLAYDFDNHLIVGVINSPPSLVVLDTDGNPLRYHMIHGANDTEGITYIGNGKFAMLQEKRRSLILFTLPAELNAPILVDEAHAFKLDIPKDKNNGPEGITYDAQTDTFYIVKERVPTGLYAVQGLLTNPGSALQTNLSHYLAPLDFATDLSGITFSPKHEQLILLSDEAQMLIAIDLNGQLMGHFDLAPWDLSLPPPQPEGITVGPDNTIYMVSEPNLFYRLRPRVN